nr:MAG: replication initiator protein [Microvirus sp.]
MPCFHPVAAWQAKDGSIVFSERLAPDGRSLNLPCGRCVGCRLERSRQWAVRCVHESKSHEANSFITLTYDDDHLPSDRSLNYEHFQRFIKRLRKRHKVRFYMCGEYGDEFDRPHFHACIFGYDFAGDRVVWKRNNGFTLFRSQELEALWPYGFTTVAEFNFETAAYTARYIMKKITGDLAEDHYRYVDPDTGEIFDRVPEFNRMSLKPGIGGHFYDRFSSDIFPHDYVVVNGVRAKPPRYYDKMLKRFDEETFDFIKEEREYKASLNRLDNTFDRLGVKEQVAVARISTLKRSLK